MSPQYGSILKQVYPNIHYQTYCFFKRFEIIKESCVNPVTLSTLRAWRLVRCLEGCIFTVYGHTV